MTHGRPVLVDNERHVFILTNGVFGIQMKWKFSFLKFQKLQLDKKCHIYSLCFYVPLHWLWRRVWGASLCWLSHIQQGCCGFRTASGVSMYKQAYKWSTIWLLIVILLTVNKAEQALTLSNKSRPMHANSAAVGNQRGLFELRSILFRLHWL